jgi:hypothetical protein
VSLALRDCDAAFADEVRRLAGIELHATVVDPTTLGSPRRGESGAHVVTETSVTCHGSVADLWVADAATSKVSLRTVSLAETSPRARARLIALAMAELVSSSWEEVETNPEPKVPASVPPPPEAHAAVSRAIRRPSRLDLDVLADGRAFAGGALLFGGKLLSTIRISGRFVLRLDAGAGVGSRSRSLGDVDTQAMLGSLGAGAAFDFGVMRAVPWAAFYAGYARISGDAHAEATGYVEAGPWLGPGAGVDFELWPDALVHASLGISGGGTLLGLRGEVAGEDAVSLTGAWGAVSVGIGISKR